MKRFSKWLIIIFCAVVVYFLIQALIFKNATVAGDSMLPTLNDGDKIIVNRFIYRIKDPNYNDIIVFPDEENRGKFYIKRIIGITGDEIDIKNSMMYINGEPLNDDFSYDTLELIGDITYPVIVPENEYFVLGDNRNSSHDSRSSDIGFIPRADIIGRADLRIWPEFGMIGGIYAANTMVSRTYDENKAYDGERYIFS